MDRKTAPHSHRLSTGTAVPRLLSRLSKFYSITAKLLSLRLCLVTCMTIGVFLIIVFGEFDHFTPLWLKVIQWQNTCRVLHTITAKLPQEKVLQG